MNKILKRIIIGVLFVCLMTSILWYLNGVFVLKRSDGITPMKQLYAQEKDTVDVLIVGSSHAGMNFESATLWQEHGVSSFALWGSVQPFWNTYYFLKEALKTQTPKVVVMDVYAATFKSEYSDSARQITNVCGMKFNFNRLQAAWASAPEGKRLDLFFGMPNYHSRYNEITENDFKYFPWSEGLIYSKGTGSRYGVGDYELVDVSGVTETAEIYEKQEKYLRKIIELCRDEGIPLVLTKTPSAERVREQPYYNTVQKIADEYGVEFLNFNLMDEETGFTAENYWTDGHMNMDGMRKITSYLGDYLVEKYSLENHSGDEKYASWDKSTETILNDYLRKITGAEDYTRELVSRQLGVELVKTSAWENGEAYSALIDDLKLLGVSEALFGAETVGQWYSADSSCEPFEKTSDEVKEELAAGIFLTVYDKTTNEVIDTVMFLEKDGFALTRG